MISAAARGWSPNTQRAFLSDLRLWHAGCRRSGVATAAAQASDVAGYIRARHVRKLLGGISETEMERSVAAVSSHSIRVGVAQDNIAVGANLPAIMQAYRWRDPKTVMRYGANLRPNPEPQRRWLSG